MEQIINKIDPTTNLKLLSAKEYFGWITNKLINMNVLKLGNKEVSPKNSTFIIAEIGINHNGDVDIAKKLIPKSKGGLLEQSGSVEVISSIDLDKKDIPNDLRWGVYIVIKAQNEYVKNCFKDYGMVTDSSGSYSAIWRPYHYIGLELAQSIYSIVLDNKATGHTKNFNAEIASVAKKDLKAGQKLDGEGGYCARGRLISSKRSKQERILPMGYTDNAVLKNDIMKDEFISLDDVELNLSKEIIEAREYQYNLI